VQRGPYKNRKRLLDEAIKLRQEGFGIEEIGAKLGEIPSKTIWNWVKDVEIKGINAYIRAGEKRKIPFLELKSGSQIRIRLIQERGNKCEKCGLYEWRKEKISIEVHHKDGNKKNNQPENLELLCPNCHSQTDNYRNNKRA